VRVATWNVNSVKQRLPRLLPWLDERSPDVVCLQETKLADDAFTALLGAELAERGYEVALNGEVQWNGVAILSRAGLEDVSVGIDGGPGFPHPEARAVAATCGGIRVHSVYVPNGREPGSEHYRYKLEWLAALRGQLAAAAGDAVVCGDMNIAPTDADVFDPAAYAGHTHVTDPERAALADLIDVGFVDVVRARWPDERVFTYWDYRAGMFHQDLGMRMSSCRRRRERRANHHRCRARRRSISGRATTRSALARGSRALLRSRPSDPTRARRCTVHGRSPARSGCARCR
jgi:exodeoxyribonuclease-3